MNDFNYPLRRQENFLERPLPSSEESERAILGAILLDNSLIADAIAVLVPADFYGPLHRRVYTAMLALFERSVKIDPIMIGEELKKDGSIESIGGVATITNLSYGLPHFTKVDEYIETVKIKSRARKLVEICNLSTSEALEESEDFSDVLDRHEQLISYLRNKDTASHFVDLPTSVKETYDQIHAFAASGGKDLLGIATGFREIDIATSGLEKGDHIVLAARPSMGKTALGLQICCRAAALEPDAVIAVFSLEMSRRQLVQRILSSYSNVDLMRMRSGRMTNVEWTRLADVARQMVNRNFVIDDTPALTTMQIKAKLRRLMAERKRIDLVMLDHGALLGWAGDQRQSDHQKTTQNTKDLKQMAKEFDVPFLELYQLSRAVEKRNPPKPIMSDLRESGSIEEIADKILFIYRPEYYLKEKCPEQDRGIAEIIIGKNRNGPTDMPIKLAFLKQYARFEDLLVG